MLADTQIDIDAHCLTCAPCAVQNMQEKQAEVNALKRKFVNQEDEISVVNFENARLREQIEGVMTTEGGNEQQADADAKAKAKATILRLHTRNLNLQRSLQLLNMRQLRYARERDDAQRKFKDLHKIYANLRPFAKKTQKHFWRQFVNPRT